MASMQLMTKIWVLSLGTFRKMAVTQYSMLGEPQQNGVAER
jgi:hypothetical protein